ncbi:MAG: hypothetical protein Q9216_005924 [Gyalolechia sp. 2 TL-2023]
MTRHPSAQHTQKNTNKRFNPDPSSAMDSDKSFPLKPASEFTSICKNTRSHKPKTNDSPDDDADPPDLDDELERLRSQHSNSVPFRTIKKTSHPNFPPTPATTPCKIDTHEPSFTPSTPVTPTRDPAPPFNALLTPMATAERSHKRKYFHIHDNDNNEETSQEILTPSKRSRTAYSTTNSNSNINRTQTSHNPNLPQAIRGLPNIASTPQGTTLSTTPTKRKHPLLSSFEAKRVKSSVLEQVDFEKVAEDVACNRRARVYERAVTGMLERWVEGVVTAAREERAVE